MLENSSHERDFFKAIDKLVYPFTKGTDKAAEEDKANKSSINFKIKGKEFSISVNLIQKTTSIGTAILSFGTAQLSYYLIKKAILALNDKQRQESKVVENCLFPELSISDVKGESEDGTGKTEIVDELNKMFLERQKHLHKYYQSDEPLPTPQNLMKDIFNKAQELQSIFQKPVFPFNMFAGQTYIREEKDTYTVRIFGEGETYKDYSTTKNTNLEEFIQKIKETPESEFAKKAEISSTPESESVESFRRNNSADLKVKQEDELKSGKILENNEVETEKEKSDELNSAFLDELNEMGRFYKEDSLLPTARDLKNRGEGKLIDIAGQIHVRKEKEGYTIHIFDQEEKLHKFYTDENTNLQEFVQRKTEKLQKELLQREKTKDRLQPPQKTDPSAVAKKEPLAKDDEAIKYLKKHFKEVKDSALKERTLERLGTKQGIFTVQEGDIIISLATPWGIETKQFPIKSLKKEEVKNFTSENQKKQNQLEKLGVRFINSTFFDKEYVKPGSVIVMKEGNNFVGYQRGFGNKLLEFEVDGSENFVEQLQQKINANMQITQRRQDQLEKLRDLGVKICESEKVVEVYNSNKYPIIAYMSKSQEGAVSVIINDEKYTIPYEQDLNEGMVQILSKARENKHAQAPKKSSDAAATIKAFTERGGHYFVNQDLAAAFLEKNRTAEMVVYSERVVYQEQGKYFVAHHFVDVHNKIEFTHYTELKKLENINNLEKEINEICTHTEELIRKRIKEYEELGTEESNAKDIYQAGKLEHAQTSLERKGIGATCLYMTPRGNVHVFQNLPNGEVDYKRIPFDQPLTSQIEEITRENMKRPSTRSVQYEQIKAEKKVADSEEKALNALSPNKRDFRIWLINPQNPHGPCGFAYSDGKGGEPIITIIKTEQDLLKEITLKHGVAGLQTVRMAERYEVGDLIKLKAQFLEFCDPKDRGAKFSDLPTIYKKLARLNHPDRASAENVEKFKEMSLKYKELIDLIMNRISASNLQERLEILDTEIQKRK